MKVRTAAPADAADIARIQVAGWHEAYADIFPAEILEEFTVALRTERWSTYLREPGEAVTLLAIREDAAVGFCSVGPCRDDDKGERVWEIWALYVAPEAWRSGVGRALTDAAFAMASEAGADEMTLWVLSANAGGRRFYESYGFAEDGATTEYEKGGETFPEVRYICSLERDSE